MLLTDRHSRFGGQAAGRIDRVRPAAEVIQDTVAEFYDSVRALGRFLP